MAGIEDLKSRLISKNGMAMANQFSVELPTIVGSKNIRLKGLDARTANILCKSVTMPGKQIVTLDKQIGLYNTKVVSGFAVDDVTMTFFVLNDYGIKRYFDSWRSLMISEKGGTKGTVSYKKDYVSDISIHQLKKPVFRTGFDVGPLSVDLDLLGRSIYSVKLIDAFPTTINSIELSNEADGLVEMSAQFSFTNWEVIQDNRGLGDINFSLSGGVI